MEKESLKRLSRNLKEAQKLLKEIGETPLEGVNTNLKRALISIDHALFDLGEEEQ